MSNENISLYNSENIHALDWPETVDAQYAKKFLLPIIHNGIHSYIENIHADSYVLKIDQFVLPLVVVTENYDNSWVCSPHGHYIGYGQQSTKLIDNKVISKIVTGLISGMDKISKAGRLNSVVYINNWLFSTDLYPQGLTSQHISKVVSYLKERFPNHAIAMRSLNEFINTPLMQTVKKEGFKLVASRQVYLTNTKNEEIFQRRILKSDMKLLRESPYQIVDESQISVDECAHLLHLYNLLYIVQHEQSHLQPRLNTKYIEHLFEQRLLDFKVLKHGGQTKGVAGYFERGGVMFCPFFGYDKEDPEHNVIYRCLSTSLIMEAKKRGLVFHQSAGASTYKKIRRAESFLESTAIYIDHLPKRQKLSWSLLKTFINAAAPRYMKKY